MFHAATLERPSTGPAAPGPATTNDAYARHKVRTAARQRKNSASSREIAADFPAIVNPKRRARALRDFQYFCLIYCREIFYLPFSDDHKKVCKTIQRVVESGGQFAVAMARGSGKTAMCEAACLWAALKGLHPLVMLVGATADAATDSLAKLKTQLETNDLLLEDFPEVCYPIRKLEGISQRRLLWNGERIRISFTDTKIVFPSLPRGPASSCCIAVAGLTGRIRGKKFTRPDGRDVRPSLVLIDDPQTDESARSPKQCADREKIINGAVLGLAGPDQQIAALMPCTVIEPDDMADRILNRELNPSWQGERLQFVYRFPETQAAEKLWAEYIEIYRRCKRDGRPISHATTHYRKHRREMDAGSKVGWPHRYKKDEISALQHAWNIRITRGDSAFFAEYQNEPIRPKTAASILPNADEIAARVDRRLRGTVPLWSSHLTAFVDVHEEILYWVVVALSDGFKAAVVDYGTWPDQKTAYFAQANPRISLSERYKESPGMGAEARVTKGLNELYDFLLQKQWPREDDQTFQRITRCLTDANYGPLRNQVYEVIRRRREAGLLLPSHGFGPGPNKTPISEWKKKDSDRLGYEWQLTMGGKGQLHVNFDSNSWKMFLFERLLVPPNAPGSLVLYGNDPFQHRLFCDHLVAETFDRLTSQATGRTVNVFSPKQKGIDNHYLDCLVGALVAASIDGCVLEIPGQLDQRKKRKKLKISF